jgi:hypothetical protein
MAMQITPVRPVRIASCVYGETFSRRLPEKLSLSLSFLHALFVVAVIKQLLIDTVEFAMLDAERI